MSKPDQRLDMASKKFIRLIAKGNSAFRSKKEQFVPQFKQIMPNVIYSVRPPATVVDHPQQGEPKAQIQNSSDRIHSLSSCLVVPSGVRPLELRSGSILAS